MNRLWLSIVTLGMAAACGGTQSKNLLVGTGALPFSFPLTTARASHTGNGLPYDGVNLESADSSGDNVAEFTAELNSGVTLTAGQTYTLADLHSYTLSYSGDQGVVNNQPSGSDSVSLVISTADDSGMPQGFVITGSLTASLQLTGSLTGAETLSSTY